MNLCSLYRVIGLSLVLIGCVHNPQKPPPEPGVGSALQSWVDNELSPYLSNELSSHPRFKGESLMLVKLIGPDIQPEIDGLTESIRLQIRDQLLTTPGITLPWRPGVRLSSHHRRLRALDCRSHREAAYYIGIETRQLPSGRFSISVKALDIAAQEWVSGFGIRWQGRLTEAERLAMDHYLNDEGLRGLRSLPFSIDQMDLVADYLANNLSCLIRQGYPEKPLVIHVERPVLENTLLPGVVELIGSHMSRYREVTVSDVKSEATLLLRGQTHELQPGLYQVWIQLNPRESGRHLIGLDTSTYVSADAQALETSGVVRSVRPVVAGMSISSSGRNRGVSCDRASMACSQLLITTRYAEQLFVISHQPRTGVVRLLPGGCSPEAESELRPMAREDRYRLSIEPDQSTYYAIAVNGERSGKLLGRHLELLPDACSREGRDPMVAEALDQWLDQLDRLIERYRSHIDWMAKRSTS